jgi:tetratricopeptide (TPR) repeat protein
VEVKSPEELAKEAKQAYQSGEYLEAAAAFKAAADGYTAAGDALMSAEMQNNRSVALLQGDDAEGALQAVLGTDQIFAEGGDKLRQAMALGNQAAALDALKRLEEAETAYVASADLFKDLGETDLRANVMQSLSALQLRSGRQLEALATMQAGVDNVEKPNLRQRMLKQLLKLPQKFMNKS